MEKATEETVTLADQIMCLLSGEEGDEAINAVAIVLSLLVAQIADDLADADEMLEEAIIPMKKMVRVNWDRVRFMVANASHAAGSA